MKKYSFEFISMVLSEYQKENNIKIIKQKFDISKSTLFYWIKKYKILAKQNNKEITIADYNKIVDKFEKKCYSVSVVANTI